MPLIDSLLRLVAPHDCIGCHAEGALLCAVCVTTLPLPNIRCYKCQVSVRLYITCPRCRLVSGLVSVHPAVRYDGLAKDIIWKLKFGRTWSAADEVASIIVTKLELHQRLKPNPRIILTHVPTATTRVRQRGYDQAALIARALARQCRLTYTPLLARSGQQKQIGATRLQRSDQLKMAFRPLQVNRIEGAHIILIDDVVTTGATLEAAAHVLSEAGARRVDAVVFAQA